MNTPSDRANLHTDSADRTPADVLKFLFHICTAFFGIKEIFPLHADSPHSTTNCPRWASLFTQITAYAGRKILLLFKIKRTVGKKSSEADSRTEFSVQEKTAFSYSAKSRKRGDFFVGISSAVVPAVLVDALRRTDRDIFVAVFFENKAALKQGSVNKSVDRSVMVKI